MTAGAEKKNLHPLPCGGGKFDVLGSEGVGGWSMLQVTP